MLVFETTVQVEAPVGRYSHLTTLPLVNVAVMVPELAPLQTVASEPTVAAVETALTVMFKVAPEGFVLQLVVKLVVAILVKVTAVVPALNAGVEVATVNVPEPELL